MLDQLNTRNLLHQKNFHFQSYSCVLCNTAVEETLDHLFFYCPFGAWCWSLVGIVWDTSLPIMDRLEFARAQFGLPIFMDIVILTAWCIWAMRNSIIFDGAMVVSLGQWKRSLRDELFLFVLKCKPSKKPLLQAWLCTILVLYSLFLFCTDLIFIK
jgi:hypothetical protein